jgi:5-methylthioadenosine/S-adenosylhomocysteine deaminase
MSMRSIPHVSAALFAVLIPGAAAGEPSGDAVLIRRAALILTMEPGLGEGPLGIVRDADLRFEGDEIVSVGHDLEVEGARVVDARGRILMPGFVDTHDHLWQSLIRGCGIDKDLMGWLEECVFPVAGGQITGEDAFAAVQLSLMDIVNTGITTVLDDSHSFSPEFVSANLDALERSKIRFLYAYCGRADDRTIAHIIETKTRIDTNPLAGFQLCSHPSPARFEDLRAMSQLARKLGVPLNVHLLENAAQIAEKPFELLRSVGALGPPLFVDHAIHLSDAEIELLARHDVRVAHNPISNMRLASGRMRLGEFRSRGIKVGLGLDGGGGDTSDFFLVLRTAVGIQRAASLRADAYPTVEDVLRMATLGGAEALGLESRIGSLKAGKKADLILIDPATIGFAPRWDWVAQIVVSGRPENVHSVWVGGRALKRDGRLLGEVSAAEAVRQAERAARAVRDRLSGAAAAPAN